MFEPASELSSDLEWMLQSGQAQDEEIALGLVQEYDGLLYQFAYFLTARTDLAHQISLQAITSALQSVYRYPAKVGARAWLLRHALLALEKSEAHTQAGLPGPGADAVQEMLKKGAGEDIPPLVLETLSSRRGLPLLLHVPFELSIPQVAYVLGQGEKATSHQVKYAQRELLYVMGRRVQVELTGEEVPLNELLRRAVHQAAPQRHLDEDGLYQAVGEILRRSRLQGQKQRRSNAAKEALLVGLAALVIGIVVWGTGLLQPEPPATLVVVVPVRVSATPSPRPTATQVLPPTPTPTRAGYPPFPENALYIVQSEDNLPIVSAKLGVPFRILRDLNNLPFSGVLRPGQALLIPGRVEPSNRPTPTPVTPPPQPTPLATQDLPEALYERRNHLFDHLASLWLDSRIILYGPQAYSGPPQVYLLQIWSAERDFLILSGKPDPEPDQALMRSGWEGKVYYALPSRGQPWFIPLPEDGTVSLKSLIFVYIRGFGMEHALTSSSAEASTRLLGSQTLLGRDVLVVEELLGSQGRLNRLWLDKVYGFPLRQQYFDDLGGEHLEYEIELNRVAFNSDLPSDLFDPWLPFRGGYASDPTGRAYLPRRLMSQVEITHTVEALPAQKPPPGFDPAGSELTFRFSESFDIYSNEGFTQTLPAQVYAGEYYLGEAYMPNPLFAVCRRSPQGTRLAYFQQWADGSSATLSWVELGTQSETRQIMLQGWEVEDFRFSPDDRYLAITARQQAPQTYTFFLIDRLNGEMRVSQQFLHVDLHDLYWSPDGQEVAVTGLLLAPENDGRPRVMALDIESNRVTYVSLLQDGSPPQPPQGPETPSWLLEQWGQETYIPLQDIQACTRPVK